MKRKLFPTLLTLILMLAFVFSAVGAKAPTAEAARTTAAGAYYHPVLQVVSGYIASQQADEGEGETEDGETEEGEGEEGETEEGDTEEEGEGEDGETEDGDPEDGEDGDTEDGDTEDGETEEGEGEDEEGEDDEGTVDVNVPAALSAEIAEQISQYREAGMGWGVLVKLYAMATASQDGCGSGDEEAEALDEGEEGEDEGSSCGVSIDDLVTEFKGGSGMGQLFKEYGKPAMLGVGHAKQDQKKDKSGGEVVDGDEDPDGDDVADGDEGETEDGEEDTLDAASLKDKGGKPDKDNTVSGKSTKDKTTNQKPAKSNKGKGSDK